MNSDILNNTDIFDQINLVFSSSIFKHYRITKNNVHKTKYPNSITYMDSEFKSSDRWFFFRIEFYEKSQKLIFWLNKLENRSAANLDIEKYLATQLKDNTLRDFFYLKSNSGMDLLESINKVLSFLENINNKELINIINGKIWLEPNFDWHNYK